MSLRQNYFREYKELTTSDWIDGIIERDSIPVPSSFQLVVMPAPLT
jgi:hypothetical protein